MSPVMEVCMFISLHHDVKHTFFMKRRVMAMATVTAAAENVALTLTALGRLKPHLFEEIETGKPKK